MTKSSATKFYIMGYNLVNTRNRKRRSKITKLLSLKPLILKGTFIRQFEFSENWDDFSGNVAGYQGFALQQLFRHRSSYFCYKFKTVVQHCPLSFQPSIY